MRDDVRHIVGPLQLCAGFEKGVEVASIALQNLFEDDHTEAVLLVNAENAFNSVNRRVALINILQSCPSIAPALINNYRSQPKLFIQGQTLISDEGTTQGNPLAMAMYALAIAPLVKKCANVSTQIWFANDASAGGTVNDIRSWWERLVEYGPQYGYFPKASKSAVIVKKDFELNACEVFSGTDLSITTEGSSHLGIPLGTPEYRNNCIVKKIQEWCMQVYRDTDFARTQPHAAFSAFLHGVTSGWMYFMRMVPLSCDQLKPLDDVINQKFIPAVSGRRTITDEERGLLSLPIKDGGMGIPIPSRLSSQQRSLSQEICAPFVNAVLEQHEVLYPNLASKYVKNKHEAINNHNSVNKATTESTIKSLPLRLQRQAKIISQDGASSWLSAIPLRAYEFVLHKSAFLDAIALRYGWSPKDMPTRCDCGKPFSVDHALNCMKGGFPQVRHNEVRDLTAALLNEVCHDVRVEPHLQPLDGETMRHKTAKTDCDARSDISACGFWGS